MKSEPDVYSFDHLLRDGKTAWEGVRNYQARNFMMKDMKVGDEVLFYHSNAEPPGIAGLAKVKTLAHPDALQFDPKSEYHDPKASKEKPIWFCVDLAPLAKFKHFVSLDEIRKNKALSTMLVIKKGQRLSIQPVEEKHFQLLVELGMGRE